MNRLRAGRASRVEQLVLAEITVGRGGPAERDGLIGEANVRRVTIDVRVDGDRADSHDGEACE